MPAPTNVTALLATELGVLPYSDTQVADDAGVTYTLWFKFTAPPGAVMVGAWGFGDLVTYIPTLRPYVGPAATPVQILAVDAANKPCQFPVTPGVEYFLELTPNGGNPTPALLTLSVQVAPTGTAADGDFLPIADALDWPSAIYPGAGPDFLVRRFVSLPYDSTASSAANLADGTMLLVDQENARLALYSRAFQFITAPAVGAVVANRPAIGANRTVNKFYASTTTVPSLISVISASGAVEATQYNITGAVGALAPNNDESILYYAPWGHSAALKRWDLATDTALADLAAAVAFHWISDILALPDGTFLVCYASLGILAPAALFIRQYNAAGAIVQTITLDADYAEGALPRIAYAHNHPSEFAVWAHKLIVPNEGTHTISHFLTVRVSDGAILTEVRAAEFDEDSGANDDGVYGYDATATPMARFGCANSCPFLMLTSTAATEYGTEVHRIRRLRRAPHLSAEQVWTFFHSLQLDLQTGVGLATTETTRDPQIMLRWSDDGGHTWSNEHWVSAGRLGVYAHRAIWRKLGRSRDRVFEIVVSDPVRWQILAAYLNATPGTS